MFRHALKSAFGAAALAVLSLAAVAPAANAQITVFDTFRNGNEFDSDGAGLISGPDTGDVFSMAMQFTAQASANDLLSLSLALRSGGTGDVTVGLYENTGSDMPNFAASPLMSATRNDVTGTGIYEFSSAQPVALSAGTKYWVHASATGSISALWLSNYALPEDNLFIEYRNGSVNTQASAKSAFSVVAAGSSVAAPEPGSIALALTAGVPILSVVRRSRRK